MVANKKSNDVGCLSMSQEDLQAAINAFNHALARCDSQENFGAMSASLAMELAMNLGCGSSEGIEYLYKAVHSHPTVQAIAWLVSHYIKQGNYHTINSP